MDKKSARELMKKMRREMPEEERIRQNNAIKKRLLESSILKNAKSIFPFVSYGTEVDTIAWIKQLFLEKPSGRDMTIAVPKVQGKEMEFYEVNAMEDLQPGYHGILEPVTEKIVEATEGVMILPGLCFDKNGSRIGYGGGYYDRYLCEHDTSKLTTVAIAYDFQLIDVIEAEEHDRKPDYLVMASGSMKFL